MNTVSEPMHSLEIVNSAENAPACLSSWKEVANYLGKGVRTVQRWEQSLNLPVHRPVREKHVILAFPEELSHWVRTRGAHTQDPLQRIEKALAELEAVAQDHPELREELIERCRSQAEKLENTEQRRRSGTGPN